MGGADNHCAYVMAIVQGEVDMMWKAVDGTTCPDVQRILDMRHEVIHYLHPELDGNEDAVETMAANCGPH